MFRHILVAGVAGLMMSGFAMASNGDDATLKCRFEVEGLKKDAVVCHAFGKFDTHVPVPVAETVTVDRDDRLMVECDDVSIFNGKMVYNFVPDADDHFPTKIDTLFKGITGMPKIFVEDLNWTTLTGVYVAELTFNDGGVPVVVPGHCEFKK